MTPADLRSWRETAGLSQTGLAALLGTTQNTISRWELGNRSIPSYLWLALKSLECHTKAAERSVDNTDYGNGSGMGRWP